MEVKDLLAKEYALRHTKLQEDFERGQPELFGSERIAGLGSEDLSGLANRFKDMGRTIGAKYSDMIETEVMTKLRNLYKGKNIDVEAQSWAGEFDSPEDMIHDNDDYMEFAIELAAAFIEGMSESWFYPLDAE